MLMYLYLIKILRIILIIKPYADFIPKIYINLNFVIEL